ncbi:MAG: glutamate 5-kinase [Planctomycetes bacterium]|nr:glutamate 5-kinase [Planctomycetota bacterium]
MDASSRTPVAGARRVVVKLGTRVLTHDDGSLALGRLFGLIESLATLRQTGREVILVSSGAVGLGQAALGLEQPPTELALRQACAAVGQSRLMGIYEEGFSRLGLVCAQVLLSQGDFADRLRYLNLRNTFSRLLELGVIPVVNENDAVATDELAWVEGRGRPVFGDNDRLSALVATKLGADLLVLLTDVAGVFARDPREDPDAPLLSRVDDVTKLAGAISGASSAASRGGMLSKVAAAEIAARSGCEAVIASGREPDVLTRLVAGAEVGTWFPAQAGLPARQRWIAFASAARGALHLDAGAVRALREKKASLLAPGVARVEGEFEQGEVVELFGPEGGLVGRGLVSCDATQAEAWRVGQAPAGTRNHDALVHRDHLVLEPS